MKVEKRTTGPRDRENINVHEGFDVRYWGSELGISAELLREIVAKVGSKLDDVRSELKSRGHNAWRA